MLALRRAANSPAITSGLLRREGSRRHPTSNMASEEAESWGLAALGVVEDVCVELLEGIEDRSGQWLLQVDIGQFGFTCELCSPERLRELAEFFTETFRTGRYLDEQIAPGHYRRMTPKELILGTIGGVSCICPKMANGMTAIFCGWVAGTWSTSPRSSRPSA